jgi:demethylmenaquinone methyltransferase/2-methoxy-6-polyprenyl-1,4-benzoquinol methylase
MTDDGMQRTLGEQMLYYEARAGEYDEWWFRTGRYDQGPAENDAWFSEQAEVRAQLIEAIPHGDVADLACGTGIWTDLLAAHANHVTAIDGSVAMLSKAEERLVSTGLADRVTFLQADLFAWRPAQQFDAVFLGFFLSHVPDHLLDRVLQPVASALKPGGKLLFIDSRRESTSSSPDQPLPDEGDQLMVRRLNDGRTFRILKIFRDIPTMRAALARNGLKTDVRETARYFQYGIGEKVTD